MAILAANVNFRAFSLFSWVTKNGPFVCLKKRDFNSSVPVRYIPKKFRNDERFESSSSWINSRRNTSSGCSGPIKRTEITDGDLIQRSISLYGTQKEDQTMKNSFSSGEIDRGFKEEFDSNLWSVEDDIIEHPPEIVEDLNLNEKNALLGGSNEQDAEQVAIKSLAARALTVAELRKKLQQKRFSTETVDDVLDNFKTRCKMTIISMTSTDTNPTFFRYYQVDNYRDLYAACGLINDNLFAETFSRSRWTSSTWGPRRIKNALLKKGIREVDAEKAVKLVFEDGERGSRSGLSKASIDHLFVQASKQWLKGRDVPLENRKCRMVRWLRYRGFNWDIISSTLRKLELEYPISHSL